MKNTKKRNVNTDMFLKKNKRTQTLACVFVAVLLIIVIPIFINELYKVGPGYITVWNASDVLEYYSVILSGIISISTVVGTIWYTRKDLEKQINFSKSQFNVPFFVIDRVYTNNDKVCFDQTKGKLAWQKDYPISRQKTTDKMISIVLKNIGDGIAITPMYFFDSQLHESVNNPIFVEKGNTLKIEYNPKAFLHNSFGESILPEKSQSIPMCITISYQNISGIQYTQDIILEHRCVVERQIVTILVNSITPQKVIT